MLLIPLAYIITFTCRIIWANSCLPICILLLMDTVLWSSLLLFVHIGILFIVLTYYGFGPLMVLILGYHHKGKLSWPSLSGSSASGPLLHHLGASIARLLHEAVADIATVACLVMIRRIPNASRVHLCFIPCMHAGHLPSGLVRSLMQNKRRIEMGLMCFLMVYLTITRSNWAAN